MALLLKNLTQDQFDFLNPSGTWQVYDVRFKTGPGRLLRSTEQKIVTDTGEIWSWIQTLDNKQWKWVNTFNLRKPAYHGTGGYDLTRQQGRQIHVHKLVLQYFKQEEYFSGAWCDHDDRNPKNNDVTNLFWVTPKENSANRVQTGCTQPYEIIATHPVHGTRSFASQNQAAKALGILQYGISVCLNPKYPNNKYHGWSFARGEKSVNSNGDPDTAARTAYRESLHVPTSVIDLATGERKDYPSRKEAAADLGVAKHTLAGWLRTGRIPKKYKLALVTMETAHA